MYIVDNQGCSLTDVAEFARDFYIKKKQGVYVTNVGCGEDLLRFDFYYDGTEDLWFQYRCCCETDVDIFSREYCLVSEDIKKVSRCANSRDVDLDCVVLARARTSRIMECSSVAVGKMEPGKYIPSIASFVPSSVVTLPSYVAVGRIGFYPIVPDARWFETVAHCGVKTIQLRVKDKTLDEVGEIVQRCAEIANKNGVAFIVNDYWELARKYGAFGVHLGQDDIKAADMYSIEGMCLGISTHCYHELARAKFYQPSYIALGPIYETTSKEMPYEAQGLDLLKEWVECNSCTVVAIGGITLANIGEVLKCGVGGVAVISAVTGSLEPKGTVDRFVAACAVVGAQGSMSSDR